MKWRADTGNAVTGRMMQNRKPGLQAGSVLRVCFAGNLSIAGVCPMRQPQTIFVLPAARHSRPSSPPPRRAPRGKTIRLILSVRAQLLHRRSLLLATMEILRNALRSFREHMRIRPSRDSFLDLTPPSLPVQSEELPEWVRINARLAGIEQLESTHPWVDLVDRRMFLLGFDAAELWNASRIRIETTNEVHHESCQLSSD